MGARFSLGRTLATPGALDLLQRTHTSPAELLDRHVSGDFGDVPAEDARENELSITRGFRIISSYNPAGTGRIWIITEADRSATTLLLPEEY
jgi:hypothetical protein